MSRMWQGVHTENKFLCHERTRTHGGERPYTCFICDRAFRYRANLLLIKKLRVDYTNLITITITITVLVKWVITITITIWQTHEIVETLQLESTCRASLQSSLHVLYWDWSSCRYWKDSPSAYKPTYVYIWIVTCWTVVPLSKAPVRVSGRW